MARQHIGAGRLAAVVVLGLAVGLFVGAAYGAPKASYSAFKIDLGKFRQGKMAETTIGIGNRGDEPLQILEVQRSCPCATTDLPDDPAKRVVPPGGSFSLKVKYDTKDRFGPSVATIIVTTNDPEQPRAAIDLNLDIEVLVLTRPDKGVFWGMAPRGDEVSKEKDLVFFPGNGSKDIELLDIRMAEPTLTVTTVREPVKDSFRIRAHFRVAPDVPMGPLNNEVIARLRVSNEETTVKLPVKGDVVGDVLVMPPAIVCAPKLVYAQNQPLSEEGIIVRASRETDPLPDVLGAVAVGPLRCIVHKNVKPEWGTKVDRHIVEVRTSENAPPGAQSGTVFIMTTSKDQPIVAIPVFFRMGFRVAATPAQVTLEPEPGKPAEQRVTLKDATDAALTIQEVRYETDLVEVKVETEKTVDANNPASIVIKATAVPTPERMATMVAVVTDQPGAERILVPVLIRAPQPAPPAQTAAVPTAPPPAG